MPIVTATPQDVQVSLGRTLTTAQAAQVEMWLRDAVTQIRVRFRDRADLLDPDVVALVTREAVVAKVKAPDAATRSTVAVDDATVTRDYTRATGQVSLDDWWDLLEESIPDSSPRESFSIRLGGAW